MCGAERLKKSSSDKTRNVGVLEAEAEVVRDLPRQLGQAVVAVGGEVVGGST